MWYMLDMTTIPVKKSNTTLEFYFVQVRVLNARFGLGWVGDPNFGWEDGDGPSDGWTQGRFGGL